MNAPPFPSGVFVGEYKGIAYYAAQGKYQCLFGWLPQEFHSIRALKLAVTRREKADA